jgi:hypothetical protein
MIASPEKASRETVIDAHLIQSVELLTIRSIMISACHRLAGVHSSCLRSEILRIRQSCRTPFEPVDNITFDRRGRLRERETAQVLRMQRGLRAPSMSSSA